MSPNYAEILNLIKQGQWDQAHESIQAYSDPLSCQIHAHLHRIEGDLSNANYWYQRARSTMPNVSIDDEWEQLNQLL